MNQIRSIGQNQNELIKKLVTPSIKWEKQAKKEFDVDSVSNNARIFSTKKHSF